MKLHILNDCDSEKSWISGKWHNGDWNIYFVLRVQYLDDLMGDEAPAKYLVEILAVSPEAAGQENVRKAWDCCGMDLEKIDSASDVMKVEAMKDYGIFAPLYSKSGNNMSGLLNAARQELKAINIMFGFKMDCPVNRIGDTGWDWLQGNVGAALHRAQA